MDADISADFRHLIHALADGLTAENVIMLRYLCKDAIPHGMEIPTALGFFEYFETKGWINPNDMSFLAEVLYRINRHDLLKRLPGVKNRRDYEENFLMYQRTQNFTPFRIACFKLQDELTQSDFQVFKNSCRDKLSTRNYRKSTDVINLLVCLEEEDLISDGDLEFILKCLQRLSNQVPYQTFYRLSQGDTTITLPKRHQSSTHFASSSETTLNYYLPHSQSLPQFSPFEYRRPAPPYTSYNPGYPVHSHPTLNNMSIPVAKTSPPSYFDSVGHDIDRGKTFPTKFPEESRTFSENECSSQKAVIPQTTASSSPLMSRIESSIPQYYEPEETSRNSHSDPAPLNLEPCVSFASTSSTIPCSSSETAIKNPASFSSVENDCTGVVRRYASEISNSILPGQKVEELTGHDYLDEVSGMVPSIGQESSCESLLTENSSQSPENVTPLEQYEMNNKPRGMCLIVNNFRFEGVVDQEEALRRLRLGETNYPVPNVGLKDREGSQKDATEMCNLFESFGFLVKVYENLDSRAILKVISEYAAMDHSNFDCFVVAIMSHGLQGCVYGVDGMKVRLSLIQKKFKPEKCPTLVNKPKLFFFQACQGDRRMDGHSSELSTSVASSDDIVTDSPEYFLSTPSEADFLIGHSTVPGYLSYRSRTSGSWYISTLVKNLKEYHQKEDLMSIMVKVNSEMATKPFNQMSMPITTLRKKVFFSRISNIDIPVSEFEDEH